MANLIREMGREQLLGIRLLTEAELATELKVERVTLWRWRKAGMPYLALGSRTVRYSLPEVLYWLEDRQEAA